MRVLQSTCEDLYEFEELKRSMIQKVLVMSVHRVTCLYDFSHLFVIVLKILLGDNLKGLITKAYHLLDSCFHFCMLSNKFKDDELG